MPMGSSYRLRHRWAKLTKYRRRYTRICRKKGCFYSVFTAPKKMGANLRPFWPFLRVRSSFNYYYCSRSPQSNAPKENDNGHRPVADELPTHVITVQYIVQAKAHSLTPLLACLGTKEWEPSLNIAQNSKAKLVFSFDLAVT